MRSLLFFCVAAVAFGQNRDTLFVIIPYTTSGSTTAGELRFLGTDNTHYTGFKAAAGTAANRIWTLPAADGTSGQALTTNGSGVLSWASPSLSAPYTFTMSGAGATVTVSNTGSGNSLDVSASNTLVWPAVFHSASSSFAAAKFTNSVNGPSIYADGQIEISQTSNTYNLAGLKITHSGTSSAGIYINNSSSSGWGLDIVATGLNGLRVSGATSLGNTTVGNLSASAITASSCTGCGVTSVAMSLSGLSALFTLSGSPITSTGTFTLTQATAAANRVYAGPASGAASGPTFRNLVAADIPTLSSYLAVANNLSDVASASGARANLGLGTAATHATEDFLLASAGYTGSVAVVTNVNFAMSSFDTVTLQFTNGQLTNVF